MSELESKAFIENQNKALFGRQNVFTLETNWIVFNFFWIHYDLDENLHQHLVDDYLNNWLLTINVIICK